MPADKTPSRKPAAKKAATTTAKSAPAPAPAIAKAAPRSRAAAKKSAPPATPVAPAAKKSAGKAAAPAGAATGPRKTKIVARPAAPTAEERQRWIAIAAYHRAEQRGFTPGYELQDWLEAEAEIGALFGAG